MTVGIIGELTADERNIVLLPTGPDGAPQAMTAIRYLTPAVKQTKPSGGFLIPATWPACAQLATTFGSAWLPQSRLREWLTRQVCERAPSGCHDLRVTPPAGLVPRAYQVDAAVMFRETGRMLLFDEPGTGKTISTILAIVERAITHQVLPVLVICPASVVTNWVQEFNKWAPSLSAIAWRGSKTQRTRLIGRAQVYVASYDTTRNDAHSTDVRDGNPLVVLGAQTVVADECHRMKGHQTQQSRAARRLAERAPHFVGLSGTPITHHPGDLWPSLVALEPGAWPSRERWVNRYCLSVPGDYGQAILGLHPGFEPEYRTTLTGRHRRVAKADVLSQLPPKVYSIRTVELPSAYRKAYDDMERQMLAELPDGGELSVMSVLAQLTRLSQMACAAADVEVTWAWNEELGEEVPHQKVTLKAPSWKVDALLDVMAERPGQPVVCFAPSRQLMVLARDAALAAGYEVGAVWGGQTAHERDSNVERFQDGKMDLICVTTGAGGVGLTLTAAGTCVFLQRPWSLVEAIQAEDRLHRISAERHTCVEIIDVVAAKTIDTRVRAVLRGKAGQLADVVQDPRIVAELLGGSSVTRQKVA